MTAWTNPYPAASGSTSGRGFRSEHFCVLRAQSLYILHPLFQNPGYAPDITTFVTIPTYDHVFDAQVHEPLRWVGSFSKNLPSLVPKARHLGGSAFCNFYRLGVSEQALGGIPLGFGIVVEQ